VPKEEEVLAEGSAAAVAGAVADAVAGAAADGVAVAVMKAEHCVQGVLRHAGREADVRMVAQGPIQELPLTFEPG